MLSWLDKFFSAASSTIGNAISNTVHWAIHALASVVFAVFSAVGAAWTAFVDATGALVSEVGNLALNVYHFANHVMKVLLPAIYRWAAAELKKLEAYAESVYHWALKEFDTVRAWVEHLISDLTSWVLRDIWDPLKKYADQIWDDLKKWGYVAWWWITHLPDLAEAMIFHIAASTEKHAWELANMLGQFFLSLIIANLNTMLTLIEDIITAVL